MKFFSSRMETGFIEALATVHLHGLQIAGLCGIARWISYFFRQKTACAVSIMGGCGEVMAALFHFTAWQERRRTWKNHLFPVDNLFNPLCGICALSNLIK